MRLRWGSVGAALLIACGGLTLLTAGTRTGRYLVRAAWEGPRLPRWRMKTARRCRGARNRSVALSIVAAVIEGYDATVFAVYAVVIGAKFFATDSGASSLLLAMSAFAAGYLTRPLGSLLMGAIADRLGRKHSVTVIVIVMCTTTGVIGLLPTYETIGVLASVIVVLARMLHGLAAGGSTGTGTLYIAELVPERHRGLFVSAKQSASVGSFLLEVLCGTVLLTAADAQASTWVWRIPFLVALPFGLSSRAKYTMARRA